MYQLTHAVENILTQEQIKRDLVPDEIKALYNVPDSKKES